MRGLALIALPILLALLGATIVLVALPNELNIGHRNELRVLKAGWAYDQYGRPVAVIDLSVEGHVTVLGVHIGCLHKTVLPEVGPIASDYGKIRGALDPYDPTYPGVIYVSYNYTIAMGKVVWVNVGMGRVETHVLASRGEITYAGGLVLHQGNYVMVLELGRLGYGADCPITIILKNMKPVSVRALLT